MVEAMQFAFQYASEVSVFCMMDREETVEEEVRECRPDVVLLDGITEGSRCVERIPQVRAAAGDALVVVMIEEVNPDSAERLIEADLVLCNWPGAARKRVRQRREQRGGIRRLRVAEDTPVTRDRNRGVLTTRELEILRSVAEGDTNAAIARKLWVTEQTVKFHLTNIYRKLHVTNRTEATQYAIQPRLIVEHDTPTDTGDAAESTADTPAPDVPTPHR
jgi:DNA-binding NarL/FixJ family response regulator